MDEDSPTSTPPKELSPHDKIEQLAQILKARLSHLPAYKNSDGSPKSDSYWSGLAASRALLP